MVNLPPDQNDRRDRPGILSFDEMVAVVLALLGIGTVLWWGMGRDNRFFEAGARLGLPSRISESEGTGLPGSDLSDPLELDAETADPYTSFDEKRAGLIENDQMRGVAEDDRDNESASETRSTSEARTSDNVTVQPVAPIAVPGPTTPDVGESPTAASDTPQPLDISDVPIDHWAYPFIKPMYDQGYLPDLPSGQFQPDSELTRAELAALLNEAFPLEGSGNPQSFVDIPDNYWATPAINKAIASGFMSGYPDNEFKPDQPVPRYQVLVTLASGLNLAPPENVDAVLQQFIDSNNLPDWARPQVAAAAQEGLIVNHPNLDQLKPTQTATRADITAMIHQALVNQGKLEPVKSPYTLPSE
jgi:hypothetical protein